MNQAEIQIKVTEILMNKLGISAAEVSLESNLKDLGADSLEQIEIILEFEKEFGISIPEDIGLEDKNLESLCRYIGDEILLKSVK
jgi:acyl carrier protein